MLNDNITKNKDFDSRAFFPEQNRNK